MNSPSSDAWWTRAPEPSGAPIVTEVAGPGVAGPGVAGPGVAGPGVAGPGVAGPGVEGLTVQVEPPVPPAVTVVLPRRADAVRRVLRRPGRRPRPAPHGPGWPRLALTAAAATVTGVGLGVLLLRPDPPHVPPAPTPAVVGPVDGARVSATASSTQAPDGDITYGAANTLDGDETTAWNSNGEKDGNGPGITLTYTFAQPLDLRGITVRNGYQKVHPRPGRAPVDLYPVNERVRRLRVVTDAGRWTWDLADARAPQSFGAAAGRTRSVRLEIVTVYPSTTYPDVALSEVSFTAART